MLQPSDNFTATQIRFLQNEASGWIAGVNSKIIEAANDGKSETRISIYDQKNGEGAEYYKAPEALTKHFTERGFTVEWGGQSFITIKW